MAGTRVSLTVLALTLVLHGPTVDGFLWGWMQSSPPGPLSANGLSSEISKVTVTFGLSTTDEKFLQEAKKFELEHEEASTEVSSELADCHRRLVLSLKQECSKMNEEQVGKMAVNLLNCQNALEKRRRFRCTPKMSLADCTREMDGNTYTVYQLMMNRALAVCHSVNQRLFRLKTEMLVNHLATASHGQLGNLERMHGWHLKLQTLQDTAQTQMQQMSKQHDAMVATQQSLIDRQKSLEDSLSENAQRVAADQELLRNGGSSLLQLTSQVKEQLDATVSEVQRQEELLKQQRTVMDLALSGYETALRTLMTELGGKGENLLEAQDAVYMKVQASLEGIDKVNKSLGSIGRMLITAQDFVGEQMRFVQSSLVDAEVSTDTAVMCLIHLGVLVILMLISSFLQVPLTTRLFILFCIPFNVYLRTSLEYIVSATDLCSALAFVIVTELLLGFCSRRNPKKSTASKHDVEKLIETIKTMEQRINDIVTSPKKEDFLMPYLPPPYERERDFTADVVGAAVTQDWDRLSIAASDISSSQISTSEKQRCQGTNRDGMQCKRMTSSSLCPTHRRIKKQ